MHSDCIQCRFESDRGYTKVASGINKYMDKTYYILYQVTNNLNGKIYVGVHKTKNLDDGYMGSGKVINAAIKKYGIENFTRIILEQFENAAAMYAREKEVVTDEFLLREDTYNLRRGGHGGFDYINSTQELRVKRYQNRTPESYEKMRQSGFETQKKLTSENRNSFSKAGLDARRLSGSISKFAELNLTPEFQEKRKIAFKKTKHSQGEKNSQFGSKWITNEVSNKKVKKDDPVPEGWRAGRKMSR